MSQIETRNDFEWTQTNHPHTYRTKQILQKHPEIKTLMGLCPTIIYSVSVLVLVQILASYFASHLSYFWVVIFAYCFGGIINHSLTLAIHDISHNVVFGNLYPWANRLFGIWANLPVTVPMSVSFKKYHAEHHRFQGTDFFDSDLPLAGEARLFNSTVGKTIWMFLQPFFYTVRPFWLRPKGPNKFEIINFVVQIIFDLAIVYFFGFKALFYLFIGTLMCLGLHPMTAHFIAEHYMFAKGYETYSYYGFWNIISFNVGYHIEHHDFPYIPGSRLPLVREMAPEFYDPLPHHYSWWEVVYDWIFETNMGPFTRVKRRADKKILSIGTKEKLPHIPNAQKMKPVAKEE